ncbi:hypothetical protein [Hydrogenophaga sp.]|uniref:hypothetical protein n=1 Tax=Hydrogenophaga sp. TaxID=1904254 RepID=UPI00262A269A|nr:hypothetical protein [Hydrogenophaga sp.]MCW5654543.1 hypothetical protein [Hydrogenophaga sp.]
MVYPSYFKLLRLGQMPFQTVYGISHRRIEQMQDHEQSKTIPTWALFGRPVSPGAVEGACIDRVIISRVGYLSSGALVPILSQHPARPAGAYVVRPPGQHPARKIRVLIDMLTDYFDQFPDFDAVPSTPAVAPGA